MSELTTELGNVVDRRRGDPLRVMELSPTRFLTTMAWGQLARVVPDPRRAEGGAQALRYLSRGERLQAETRNEVQRNIKSTKKAENAKAYARYLAEVIRGERDERWATPPFALWFRTSLDVVRLQSHFGADTVAYLPFDLHGVLMDAETQHLAHFLLRDDPESYRLSAEGINSRAVGVEVYHGIDLVAARQIFHDRNLLGVVPNKNVALSSDSYNVATNITLALLKSVTIPAPSGEGTVPLERVVSVRQRQLKNSDTEWMTLSTLRSFVITMIFGNAGFEKTSGPISELPQGCTPDVVRQEVHDVLSQLLSTFAPAFIARNTTVIASPAVFAALGAVAHRVTSWSSDAKDDGLTLEEFMLLLSDVKWERSPHYWEGTAGKLTATGAFSLAGGVKDNGSKTTAALGDPSSPRFGWIRRGRAAGV